MLSLQCHLNYFQVGESIILHVRSNHFVDDFHCVIISTTTNRVLTTRQIRYVYYKQLLDMEKMLIKLHAEHAYIPFKE